MERFITDFGKIGMGDIARVGGKNASLGELFKALKPQGVGVLDGFAITADAYWHLLDQAGLRDKLEALFEKFDPENVEQLAERGHAARAAILETPLPADLNQAIVEAYRASDRTGSAASPSWRFARRRRPKISRKPRSPAPPRPS